MGLDVESLADTTLPKADLSLAEAPPPTPDAAAPVELFVCDPAAAAAARPLAPPDMELTLLLPPMLTLAVDADADVELSELKFVELASAPPRFPATAAASDVAAY